MMRYSCALTLVLALSFALSSQGFRVKDGEGHSAANQGPRRRRSSPKTRVNRGDIATDWVSKQHDHDHAPENCKTTYVDESVRRRGPTWPTRNYVDPDTWTHVLRIDYLTVPNAWMPFTIDKEVRGTMFGDFNMYKFQTWGKDICEQLHCVGATKCWKRTGYDHKKCDFRGKVTQQSPLRVRVEHVEGQCS